MKRSYDRYCVQEKGQTRTAAEDVGASTIPPTTGGVAYCPLRLGYSVLGFSSFAPDGARTTIVMEAPAATTTHSYSLPFTQPAKGYTIQSSLWSRPTAIESLPAWLCKHSGSGVHAAG